MTTHLLRPSVLAATIRDTSPMPPVAGLNVLRVYATTDKKICAITFAFEFYTYTHASLILFLMLRFPINRHRPCRSLATQSLLYSFCYPDVLHREYACSYLVQSQNNFEPPPCRKPAKSPYVQPPRCVPATHRLCTSLSLEQRLFRPPCTLHFSYSLLNQGR